MKLELFMIWFWMSLGGLTYEWLWGHHYQNAIEGMYWTAITLIYVCYRFRNVVL